MDGASRALALGSGWLSLAPVGRLVPLCYDTSMSTARLDELLAPVGACFTPEVAERLTKLRAPESVQARMEELARKSEEDTLSDNEREEYDAFVSAGNFIAVLQSKARRLLKDRPV